MFDIIFNKRNEQYYFVFGVGPSVDIVKRGLISLCTIFFFGNIFQIIYFNFIEFLVTIVVQNDNISPRI